MDALNSLAVEFDLTNSTSTIIPIDELHIDTANKNKIYWIHSNLTQQPFFHALATKLHLPEHVINLCENDDPMPKLIDEDDQITLQIQALSQSEITRDEEPAFNPLVIHITDRYFFTAASQAITALEELKATYHKSIKYAKTPCFLLFLLFDISVNEYAKVLFNFELISDQMDVEIRQSHQNLYDQVLNIKQQIMKIKRYMISMREMLARISGRKSTVISDQCRGSLHNLSNHSHMVIHEIDSIRDVLNSMLDQIDNALMQKMNETMRILTTFAAIFLPLSLITGVYGMNFQWIPELAWKYGYFYALGLIVLCGTGLFFIFKKMKWF